MPSGVNCKTVPPFQKNRFDNVRNAFNDTVGPFPAATSTSAQLLCEKMWRQLQLMPPPPVPFCVCNWPDKLHVSFWVNGKSTDWVNCMDDTSIVGIWEMKSLKKGIISVC